MYLRPSFDQYALRAALAIGGRQLDVNYATSFVKNNPGFTLVKTITKKQRCAVHTGSVMMWAYDKP